MNQFKLLHDGVSVQCNVRSLKHEKLKTLKMWNLFTFSN